MEKPGKIIGSSERTYDPTDPALQDALDRVILLYHLGKK